MDQHYCQRIPHPDPNVLRLTFEDDPDACGKPARFVYEDADLFAPSEFGDEPRKWWLCAECYDFNEIFKKI
jgi:hypothetical protein